MSITYNPPRSFWQMYLGTALLLMFAVPVGALCFLRSNPWAPEETAMFGDEVNARFPGWFKKPKSECFHSPDGTREFAQRRMENCIYSAGRDGSFQRQLFDFMRRDHDSALKFDLSIASDHAPRHYACGFIDDNHCLMLLINDEGDFRYRVWHRRFPEWWWGHLYRPEVWVGGVLALVLAYKLVMFMKRHDARILADRAQREAEDHRTTQ